MFFFYLLLFLICCYELRQFDFVMTKALYNCQHLVTNTIQIIGKTYNN